MHRHLQIAWNLCMYLLTYTLTRTHTLDGPWRFDNMIGAAEYACCEVSLQYCRLENIDDTVLMVTIPQLNCSCFFCCFFLIHTKFCVLIYGEII